MPRKGENIFKRKDGRWEGRYIKKHENGRAIYGYVFGKTYAEAKKKKSDALSRLSQVEQKAKISPLVKDIAKQWFNELKAIRKKSTLSKYETQLRKYVIPAFGNKRIDEITNENIATFCHNLFEKNLAPKTVSDILSRIKSIRKFALLQNYQVKFVSNCVKVPCKTQKIRILSLEEEKKLIGYLKENFSLTAFGILLSLFTGIRIGELCALKWSNIFFKEREIHVISTMQRIRNSDNSLKSKTVIEIGEPKSPCSIRTIPIPDDLMDLMRKMRGNYPDEAYLLSGCEHYFIEPRTMENRFKSILKKSGSKNINFHALRHTFATRCVEVGFDVKSLSEILGHANVNITLNRYVHPSLQLKRENMNKLSNFIRSQNSWQLNTRIAIETQSSEQIS